MGIVNGLRLMGRCTRPLRIARTQTRTVLIETTLSDAAIGRTLQIDSKSFQVAACPTYDDGGSCVHFDYSTYRPSSSPTRFSDVVRTSF